MNATLRLRQLQKNNSVKKDKKTVGFIAGLFGCWHKDLTRAFTIGAESYRVCANCGARRHFDTETLRTYGHFYFPLEADLSQIKRS